jgi:uncharacterized membrane protein YkgB
MQQVHGKRSPLERAKTQERIATYSVALIVGLVIVLIARAVTFSATQSAGSQERLMSLIMTIVQFIVTISTLMLVRHQVSIAVRQIEESEVVELRLQQLTEGVRKLAEAVQPDPRRPQAPPVKNR